MPEQVEKRDYQQIPIDSTASSEHSCVTKVIRLILAGVASILVLIGFGSHVLEHRGCQNMAAKAKIATHGAIFGSSGLKDGVCNNVEKILTEEEDNERLQWIINGEDYKKISLEKLQAAVQVATVSTEDMGPVDEDKSWEVFNKFHSFLESAFPLVHKHLQKEVVNKYSLLYTWKGSDESLKPIVLMAHQDVVPVVEETTDQWYYEPYSGHFDGQTIWGRGTVDDKHPLTAILEAAEIRLHDGFKPKRTVIFSFGADEESGGSKGAQHLAERLEQRYGPDSIEAVVDEGGLGVSRFQGTNMATIGVSEKGRMVGQIDLYTKGGHASVAPDHTGIGIASQLVDLIEATPHSPRLSSRNPFLGSLQCMAVHSEDMSELQRTALLKAGHDKEVTKQVIESLSKNPLMKSLMMTSQAIDMFNGGVKVNALPEKINIQIDHRIASEQRVEQVEAKLIENIVTVAKRHGLGVRANGENILDGQGDGRQYFDYVTASDSWEPAPITPTPETDAWRTFGGTVRRIYEDFGGTVHDIQTGDSSDPTNIIVTPSLMNGNTDTRYYWNLSRNIFRFTPLRFRDDPSIHTVNEHIDLDAHVEGVGLYYAYFNTM